MNNKRPKNLNLLTIRFPIPAIVSILHRISGVFLFLLFPPLLGLFGLSLSSEHNFNKVHHFLSTPLLKFLLWLFLVPLCYHWVAGLRHLLMDVHVGEELKSGRRGAQLTLVLSILMAVGLGVWLW
ncbi:MAG TPA: succinate dehydrogenase, cytochrome b556 subunit [Gammaproteobacteria bacterium]|nr:succinate dehydrogenase, cytochrome b556 subunit [Gammaproteobacteria bacterium]